MTDRHLFDLASGWALGFDDNQWILLRRRNFRTQRGWKPVSFIATNKTILLRVLRESAVQPTPDAQIKLDALPVRFKDWRVMSVSEEAA
jgi:hypothetical protein